MEADINSTGKIHGNGRGDFEDLALPNRPPRGTVREWRKKYEGSDAISVYFTNEVTYTIWKGTI